MVTPGVPPRGTASSSTPRRCASCCQLQWRHRAAVDGPFFGYPGDKLMGFKSWDSGDLLGYIDVYIYIYNYIHYIYTLYIYICEFPNEPSRCVIIPM